MSSFSSLDVCLRPERPEDTTNIRALHRAAFEGGSEARVVDALREAGAVTLSAVAVLDAVNLDDDGTPSSRQSPMRGDGSVGGQVVGHVLFSRVLVATDKGDMALLGLGPAAVLPSRQNQGIGTMMISGCLEHLRSRGHGGVVVVGSPGFYRRFGFIEAGRWGLICGLQVPEGHFMALALSSGALGGMSGVVSYRREFTQS